MAGLRCAEVLIEKGIKVTILEGRNRIGGRVCSPAENRRPGLNGARFIKVAILVMMPTCE